MEIVNSRDSVWATDVYWSLI